MVQLAAFGKKALLAPSEFAVAIIRKAILGSHTEKFAHAIEPSRCVPGLGASELPVSPAWAGEWVVNFTFLSKKGTARD